MTSFYLRPEEDLSILFKALERFSVHFLAGIEEPFTAHDYDHLQGLKGRPSG